MNRKVPPSFGEWWNGERRPYTGAFAEPIPVSKPADEIEAMRTVYFERLPALYEHYGIDMCEPDSEARLVMAVAKAHVPGFQITERKKRGRSPTSFVWLANLRRRVNALKAKGHKEHRALKLLAEEYGMTLDTLRSRYREATRGKHKKIVDHFLEMRAGKSW